MNIKGKIFFTLLAVWWSVSAFCLIVGSPVWLLKIMAAGFVVFVFIGVMCLIW